MDDGFARQAAQLTALLAVLLRSGASLPSPGAVVTAGTLGLVVYGALAVGPRIARQIATPPAAPEPAPAGTPDPDPTGPAVALAD